MGDLNNPFQRFHLDTKGGNISGGMHKTGGPSGKILPWPDMEEDLGPEILYELNATEKVGTLLGGRPDEDITFPESVNTVGLYLTTPTEKRLSDYDIADTEDAETSLPEMPTLLSLKRKERQEREGKKGLSRHRTTLMVQA